MRGTIQKRGNESWRVKAYVGRDAAGVRRYVERTVRGTRREAERELRRLLVEVDEGRHAAAAPVTFGELLDRWLDVKRRLVEPKTIESYEWVARKYIRPALADRRVASLRPIDLDALYSDLHGRGLSARTVRICHTVIRQALEQARRWGLIARNPAVDATPPVQGPCLGRESSGRRRSTCTGRSSSFRPGCRPCPPSAPSGRRPTCAPSARTRCCPRAW